MPMDLSPGGSSDERRHPGRDRRFLLAAAGLVAEAISLGATGTGHPSMIFVLGVATIVPSTIALVGSRGGHLAPARSPSTAWWSSQVFLRFVAAHLPTGFSGLLLMLAVLLMIGPGLVAISSRPRRVSPSDALYDFGGTSSPEESPCSPYDVSHGPAGTAEDVPR